MNGDPVANESATSARWLAQAIGLRDDGASSSNRAWQDVRTSMLATTQIISSLQDWMSDFWLCKTAVPNPMGSGIVPGWAPPDEVNEWPGVSAEILERYFPAGARWTNHDQFAGLLATAGDPVEASSDQAVLEFYHLDASWRDQGDLAMVQAQHIRAWLSTALGNLLSSIALSPQSDEAPLIMESHRRLLIPRLLQVAPKWGVQFTEGEIGILYNCRQSPLGTLSWSGIRIGQGAEWLRHWQWLSVDADAAALVPALRLCARLLRCRPLLRALVEAMESEDAELRQIGLAVVRRWLLSLQVMAWLEDALARRWRVVRPPDLACFAFNAVKPDWPRRFVGVSHRSADVKPRLRTLQAWRSSLFGIDANYAPSWETNTGMMWGLFAAAPVLAVVRSPGYDASIWCEREGEIARHLTETCDFMHQRMLLGVELEELQSLDRMVDAWRPLAPMSVALGHPEFPPMSMVYVLSGEAGWPLSMLRAAAALRLFHTIYVDPNLVNGICQFLTFADQQVTAPPPTNNPNGWEAYREIFRGVRRDCDPAGTVPPLLLRPEASPPHPDEADAFGEAIPDLSSGFPALADVLAALEWRATLLPWLEEGSLGDMILIDLRGVDQAVWESHPDFSLARGLAVLRAPPRPIWLMQSAGQRVDDWGLPHDRPIFTEYSEHQFAWMTHQGHLAPSWPAGYADRCGLQLSPELLRRCRQTADVDSGGHALS